MFVGAYWGKRKEARDICAKRIACVLTGLARHHSAFETWYFLGRNKSETLKNAVETSPDTIGQILKTNNRDSDGSVIEKLGFSIGVWNGSDDLPVSFSVTCGGYSYYVGNSAVLELPSNCEDDDLLSSVLMRAVLIDFVAAFDPDEAVVTSHEYLKLAGVDDPCGAGWLMYERQRGIDRIVEQGSVGYVEE